MTATFRAALVVVLLALLAALAPAAVTPAASSSGWSWRTVYKDGFGGSKLHPAWARTAPVSRTTPGRTTSTSTATATSSCS